MRRLGSALLAITMIAATAVTVLAFLVAGTVRDLLEDGVT